MLTEQEVIRSWRNLFRLGKVTSESIEKGEALIDELRGESPLRYRLTQELEELRRMSVASS